MLLPRSLPWLSKFRLSLSSWSLAPHHPFARSCFVVLMSPLLSAIITRLRFCSFFACRSALPRSCTGFLLGWLRFPALLKIRTLLFNYLCCCVRFYVSLVFPGLPCASLPFRLKIHPFSGVHSCVARVVLCNFAGYEWAYLQYKLFVHHERVKALRLFGRR